MAAARERLHCIVEIPKGSRNKYEWDPELRRIRLDRFLLDDKMLCVPEHDPNWRPVQALEDLPEELLSEIAHFFSIYNQPEGLHVDVEGWMPRDVALEALDDATRRFGEQA